MNARARSLAPFSLPLCVLVYSRASERASERIGAPGRASLFVRALFFPGALVRSARGAPLLPSVKKVPRRRRRGLTRRTIADDGRESDDESGTGRLMPVVAPPAIFPRTLDAYLPDDLGRRGLSTLSTTVVKRITSHFVFFYRAIGLTRTAVIAVRFFGISPRKCKCERTVSALFYYFRSLAGGPRRFFLPGRRRSIRKISESTLFKQRPFAP